MHRCCPCNGGCCVRASFCSLCEVHPEGVGVQDCTGANDAAGAHPCYRVGRAGLLAIAVFFQALQPSVLIARVLVPAVVRSMA